MSATVTAILNDIVSTLRSSGHFAAVCLGEGGSESAVPRAAVVYEGQESVPGSTASSPPSGGDMPQGQWLRVRARVVIRTRSQDAASGVRRVLELAELAATAIMADPSRGGNCRDLPMGPATEIESRQLNESIRRPDVEASIAIRCHLDTAAIPGSSLDGAALFSSGPHWFRPGPWQRNLERRSFPGADGELVLDLGLRARAIYQGGRLGAPTADAMARQIVAIEALVDGQSHTLVDGQGATYSGVILEKFEQTSPIRAGAGFWCEYACQYLQLP